jgi:hypothetical protein
MRMSYLIVAGNARELMAARACAKISSARASGGAELAAIGAITRAPRAT